MLLSSLFSALAMWLTIWLLTRREGHTSLRTVLLISLGVCLASYAAFRFLGSWGLPLVFCGLVWALIDRCFLTFPKALLVALVWLGSQVGFGLLIGPVF